MCPTPSGRFDGGGTTSQAEIWNLFAFNRGAR